MTLRCAKLNVPGKEDFRRIVEKVKKAPIIEEARRLVWEDIGKESISVPDIRHATSRPTMYINASLAEVIKRPRKEPCCGLDQ